MGQGSPASVVHDWMNSPGHRIQIMRSSNLYMGVGFYKAENGVYYWVQDFSETDVISNSKGSIIFDGNGGTINGNSTQ